MSVDAELSVDQTNMPLGRGQPVVCNLWFKPKFQSRGLTGCRKSGQIQLCVVLKGSGGGGNRRACSSDTQFGFRI